MTDTRNPDPDEQFCRALADAVDDRVLELARASRLCYLKASRYYHRADLLMSQSLRAEAAMGRAI